MSQAEEAFLDELIDRRAGSLGRGRGIMLRPSQLTSVRESARLRERAGYELLFSPLDNGGEDLPIDMSEVVDRFPNFGTFTLDRRCTNLNALSRVRQLKTLTAAQLRRGEMLDVSRLSPLKCFDAISSWKSLHLAGAKITHLSIGDTRVHDAELRTLPEIIGVKSLWIRTGASKLEFLSHCSHLKALSIHDMRRIVSLDGLRHVASHLRTLQIWRSPRNCDFTPIGSLAALTELNLWDLGQIENVDFLMPLHSLRKLVFEGSTTITDGHVARLRRLPSLQEAYWTNRRHYDMRWEDLRPSVA